jgi:hypothetical protein
MSFQAYLDNIKAKTGKLPEELMEKAGEKGFVKDGEKGFVKDGELLADVKAGQIVAWLKEEYDLGHGHAMAIYAYFKGKRA